MRPPSELAPCVGGWGRGICPLHRCPGGCFGARSLLFDVTDSATPLPTVSLNLFFFVASFFHFTITTIFLKLLVFFFF